MRGLRPLAELMFADFAGVCFDQIANQLAKYRYMTGGQVAVPVTIRMANGAGAGFGAQHSQTVENWFLNVPGLKIAVPGTPADAYGLLRAAVDDPDPVLYFEHKGLFNVKGELTATRRGRPARARRGRAHRRATSPSSPPSSCATARSRRRSRSPTRASRSRSIDPRTLVPLDLETIGRARSTGPTGSSSSRRGRPAGAGAPR